MNQVAARRPARGAAASAPRAARTRWHGHGELAASLVMIFPLLLAYEIGVVFAGRVNGADVVTRAAYAILGTRSAYLVVHACIAAAFLMWIRHGRRWGSLRFEVVAPVVLEAAIYALSLGAAISLLLHRLLGLSIGGDALVSAFGAGVYEELVFRLGVLGGCVALLRHTRVAVPIALAVSSLLFAAAHHLGAHGEPFTTYTFVFRAVAGAAFGAMFWFRSLAHAVYAHALYDLVVAAS
jgi:hypothetical protein